MQRVVHSAAQRVVSADGTVRACASNAPRECRPAVVTCEGDAPVGGAGGHPEVEGNLAFLVCRSIAYAAEAARPSSLIPH
jgi:hypothetical protein